MSRHDTPDTYAGPAITIGDGSGRYRAIRVDRIQFVASHPRALAEPLDASTPIAVGPDEVKLGELLSRPEAVELQVFVVDVEDDGQYVALAERDAIVTHPPKHVALRITDWADGHGPDVRDALSEISFDDGNGDARHDGEDSLRRTAAERERAGRHAHHPARRQRAGTQGGWVG